MTKTNDFQYEYVSPSDPLPVFPAGRTAYVDLETYGGAYGNGLTVQACRVRMVALTTDVAKGEPPPPVYVVDMLDADAARWRDVCAVLESYETLCGHAFGAFDLPILVRHGMKYPARVRDTVTASRVLRNGINFTHTLAVLVKEYLGVDLPKDLQKADWGDRGLSEEHLKYAAGDVAYLQRLEAALVERLTVHKLIPTYELECAILCPVAAMTLNGVMIDREAWTARALKAEADLARLTPEVLKCFPLPDPIPSKPVRITKKGTNNATDVKTNKRIAEENASRKWNLASPAQVLKMFEKIGLELPNTTYETMCTYRDDYPEVSKFLECRDLEKQAGTFGMEWLSNIHPDGRVYPNWLPQGASSGRFSCSGPNLQQTPRGATRKAITAPPGCLYVRADYSQIEARIAAKYSKDPVLIELFQKGDDIHAYAAKAVLGKLEVTPDERQIGKSLVFGLLFSMSAPSLRVYCSTNYGVKMTLREAEVYRERFFRTFRGLEAWHDRVRKTCCMANEFRTLIGRRRIVKHLQTQFDPKAVGNKGHVNMLGLGLNTPVQGTAADMLKIAVREMWDRRDEQPTARLCMLVHDEAVFEVPEGDAKAFAVWLKDVMVDAGNAILNPIPCDASVKIGKTWGG